MKKIVTIFFVTLGVIFFCIILLGVYFFVFDPFELKPLFHGAPAQHTETSSADEMSDAHPALNESQERALESVGVDPASLPTSITPEQEVCFEAVLGTERVEEIKAGAMPTATEFFRARDCI